MTETYNPRHDSSPGTDDLRPDYLGADLDENGQPIGTDGVILVVDDTKSARTCACGCSRRVAGKAKFRQGHDQRLIGILTRAARNAQEVALRSGGMMTHMSPESYGRLVLTGAGVAKLIAAIKRPVAVTPKRSATGARIAQAPAQPIKGTVKVGRWVYPARKLATGTVERAEKRSSDTYVIADAKVAATFMAI